MGIRRRAKGKGRKGEGEKFARVARGGLQEDKVVLYFLYVVLLFSMCSVRYRITGRIQSRSKKMSGDGLGGCLPMLYRHSPFPFIRSSSGTPGKSQMRHNAKWLVLMPWRWLPEKWKD